MMHSLFYLPAMVALASASIVLNATMSHINGTWNDTMPRNLTAKLNLSSSGQLLALSTVYSSTKLSLTESGFESSSTHKSPGQGFANKTSADSGTLQSTVNIEGTVGNGRLSHADFAAVVATPAAAATSASPTSKAKKVFAHYMLGTVTQAHAQQDIDEAIAMGVC